VNELERALVALGRELSVPEAPDLVASVRERLEPRRGWALRQERRRWLVAVAVAALALLGATLAIPEARSALFRVLSIGGERIELVDDLPEVPVADDLETALGERVTLGEARGRSGFQLHELDEVPDRVYLGDRGTVWFLYGSPSNVRLLVAQTPRLTVDAPAILKKLREDATRVEEVSVEGARGVFLSGQPHFVFLYDERARVVEASARLAEDVLIWDDGGVAYRLEGDFDRDDALRLARELRVRPAG
jgi:hypothetical protein